MIDKLELRLPVGMQFRSEVSDLFRVDYATNTLAGRPSRHYTRVLDLRPIGLDSFLHLSCKRGARGQHKLELLDTSKKPYSELVRQVEAVCYGDSNRLGIMRIDLCADIPDVPVNWFLPRARIRHKQLSNGIGPLKYQIIARAGIETITAGRRPNVMRFYDKVAESKMQFRNMQWKASKDTDELNFEKEFGFPENAIVTRVERQCGGGRIPEQLAVFGQLPQAANFNPFQALEISSGGGSILPDVTNCDSVNEWLIGMQANRMIQEMGMQAFRRWLNRHSNGNSARLLKRIHAFLPGPDDHDLTVETICEVYRKSVIQQLSA